MCRYQHTSSLNQVRALCSSQYVRHHDQSCILSAYTGSSPFHGQRSKRIPAPNLHRADNIDKRRIAEIVPFRACKAVATAAGRTTGRAAFPPVSFVLCKIFFRGRPLGHPLFRASTPSSPAISFVSLRCSLRARSLYPACRKCWSDGR